MSRTPLQAKVRFLALNEQTRTDVVGSISTITVTAIHVHLAGVIANGDVSISRSVCEVTGPDVLAVPPPVDPPATPGTPTTPGTPATPGTPITPGSPITTPSTPTVATPRFTG